MVEENPTKKYRVLDHITFDGDIYQPDTKNDVIELTEDQAKSLADAKVIDPTPIGAAQNDWPPSDEQVAAANFDVLGTMLLSQNVDPKPYGSKDARRFAIRELIAKQQKG